MGQPSTTRVWAALGAVYVIWGSTYLAIRYAIAADTGDEGLPPLLMSGVRFVLAGALMLAWAWRRPHRDGRPDPIGWPQWRSAAIVGTALLLGGNGLVVLGEERVSSGVAAVLITTMPLWLALLAFLLGGERLSRRAFVGLVLGFVGVVILIDPRGESVDRIGAAMVLLAALSWACGSVYSGRSQMPRRPLVMTGMQMLCGGTAMLVVSVVTGDAAELDLAAVDLRAWVAWVYLIVFGSLIAFTAYVWLLANVRLSLVGTYAFVNPVVAVALGALPPLREPIGPPVVLGSAVIVSGVALIVSSRSTPPTPEPLDDELAREADVSRVA